MPRFLKVFSFIRAQGQGFFCPKIIVNLKSAHWDFPQDLKIINFKSTRMISENFMSHWTHFVLKSNIWLNDDRRFYVWCTNTKVYWSVYFSMPFRKIKSFLHLGISCFIFLNGVAKYTLQIQFCICAFNVKAPVIILDLYSFI